MLYGKEEFSEKLFQNPSSEYRGAPFWAWNTKLDKEETLRQIEQFKEMGMGGFHMHTRVGLDTEYMGEEFLDIVQACVKKAKENSLKAYLYDEDRWPSGYAGGKVTSNPAYRSRYLVVTPFKKGSKKTEERYDSCAPTFSNGTGNFINAFRVRLDQAGYLEKYELCKEDAVPEDGECIWYVYYEIAGNSPWFNNQAYVDNLNPLAVKEFIKQTHEVYFKKTGNEFGKTIPAIFTDEPQFAHKQFLGSPEGKQDVLLPFTDDFEQTYQKTYGQSLLEHIPEILWELPEGNVSTVRFHYHDHIAERFSKAYGDQIGKWCEKHGIAMCGHMMEEPTLYSQTRVLGEVMRNLKGFTMPGIDMLCDKREYSTAKQAQSVAHQYGREGCVGEIYGVTNWDFDFRRHKLQGDWLAALGITLRVPHLTWMSMGGEAKRDYPASIGFQSPWYKKYNVIETHFARVNTVLTRGKPLVNVGVIHPVESYWLKFGPNQQTGQERAEMDEHFQQVTEWLLFGLIDFDYVSEALLKEQYEAGKIGCMDYQVLIVPDMYTIRETTLQILNDFLKIGKKVIFMGEIPQLIDAEKSNRCKEFAENCIKIPFSRNQLLNELEPFREVDIHYNGPKFLKKPNHKKNWDGERTEKYIYQMRDWGNEKWLFIANGKSDNNPDLALSDKVKISLEGIWQVEKWDTFSGSRQMQETVIDNGKTELKAELYAHDSLLLRMTKSKQEEFRKTKKEKKKELYIDPFLPVKISREEPNAMVLDMAVWKKENGEEKVEEILRIDNEIRDYLGYPRRMAALAQPWSQGKNEDIPYQVQLEYEIVSEIEIHDAKLAMEGWESAKVYLNGEEVTGETEGYYVDPVIITKKLPSILPGKNKLLMVINFTRKTNLEACYILGDFSVKLQGARAILTKAEIQGYFGSLTALGMPFYGGNAVYEIEQFLEEGLYEVQVSKFRSPVLELVVDESTKGLIALAPYNCRFEISETGWHKIKIRAFGNRVNTFGAIHDCDEKEVYFDPNAWRTQGNDWAYEYQLKTTGILKKPILRKIELVSEL